MATLDRRQRTTAVKGPRKRPTKPRPASPRTRQEYDVERSTVMRQRILDAAFDSLHAAGYLRTTTVEVCRRAGVQRGTLLHHFPDRESLLVAALEHVFERRLAEFNHEFERFREAGAARPRRPDGRTLDLLWKAVNAPSTVAWVELVVAARSEPGLSRKLRAMSRGFDSRIHRRFAELFPAVAGGSSNGPGVSLVFALMNGLVLDRLGGFEQHAPEVLSTLKVLLGVSSGDEQT